MDVLLYYTPFITDNNLRIKTCRGGLDEVRVSFCASHESIIIQRGKQPTIEC